MISGLSDVVKVFFKVLTCSRLPGNNYNLFDLAKGAKYPYKIGNAYSIIQVPNKDGCTQAVDIVPACVFSPPLLGTANSCGRVGESFRGRKSAWMITLKSVAFVVFECLYQISIIADARVTGHERELQGGAAHSRRTSPTSPHEARRLLSLFRYNARPFQVCRTWLGV